MDSFVLFDRTTATRQSRRLITTSTAFCLFAPFQSVSWVGVDEIDEDDGVVEIE
ncbi:MAG: hypothetical protein Q9199_007315 [Rusavskia elegans]